MSSRPTRQAPPPKVDRSDAAVAERFRYFLEASGLSRASFVERVDGAITAKSLFSVLNGTRRPSRALAVLIERTWGFRAAFLLHGEGPLWRSAPMSRDDDKHTRSDGPATAGLLGLSPQEADVVGFMRRSIENARTLSRELARAQLWEKLFARTLSLIAELEACAHSDDPGDRAIYPLFVKLVYEEAQFAAARHAQLGALSVRRRVHRLTDRYLERYLDEVPRDLLTTDEHAALMRMLRPILARRKQAVRAIDESLAAVATTLENLSDLGSPRALLDAAARERRSARGRAAGERLGKLLAKLPARSLPKAVRKELAAVADGGAPPSLLELLQRLARDLLTGLEVEVAVPSQSVEELRALHHATVAPLTA